MGKKYFISYGNELYHNSLIRLKEEAESLNIFDKVIIYTEEDLPEEIKNHELSKYNRGGGYWLWKPYFVWLTLSKVQPGDIVIYSDCGNKLYSHKEWQEYFFLMTKYDGLFFCYGASMEERTRKNLLDYYRSEIKYLDHFYQIQSGFFIFNKNALSVAKEWYETMFDNPQFVVDVSQEEMKSESKKFIEHRHDQAVLSCVVYRNEDKKNLKVLFQHSEMNYWGGQAILNARISDEKIRGNINGKEPFIRYVARKIVILPYRNLKKIILKKLSK